MSYLYAHLYIVLCSKKWTKQKEFSVWWIFTNKLPIIQVSAPLVTHLISRKANFGLGIEKNTRTAPNTNRMVKVLSDIPVNNLKRCVCWSMRKTKQGENKKARYHYYGRLPKFENLWPLPLVADRRIVCCSYRTAWHRSYWRASQLRLAPVFLSERTSDW